MGGLKWTFEACKEEALKYETRKEFRELSNSAYQIIVRNEWLELLCKHLVDTKVQPFWTKSRCQEEALKYNARTEFSYKSGGAYSSAKRNKWLNDICIHMVNKKYPNYWTKDRCKEEALKYETKVEYIKGNPSAYDASNRNGWSDYVCSHMRDGKNIIWTKETCREEALTYEYASDFIKGNSGAYQAVVRNGWLDEICPHFKRKGNSRYRFIYSYEFPDNHVYVGLTYNIEKRQAEHLEAGAVFNYCIKSNLEPNFKQLTKDSVPSEEASKLECEFEEHYRQQGWETLNKSKPGSLGGTFKWDKDKCHNIALQYRTRNEFIKSDRNAHAAAFNNGWLSEICSHMELVHKPKGYYTLEKCEELAKECISRVEFKKKYSTAARIVRENKWHNIVYSHLPDLRYKNNV